MSWPPRKILIATDFSDPAREAALFGMAFAADTGVEEVVLFHAPPPFEKPFGGAHAYVDEVYFELLDARDDRLRERLEAEAAEVTPELGPIAHPILGNQGDGAEAVAIAKAAEDLGCDLVVIGSRGRTGVKRALMGSVAERTVRLAKVPVMVVR